MYDIHIIFIENWHFRSAVPTALHFITCENNISKQFSGATNLRISANTNLPDTSAMLPNLSQCTTINLNNSSDVVRAKG